MKKSEFIDTLTKKLNALKVADIDEIVAEFTDHFAFKLADGYSEEEIAAKLGNPHELAAQFAAAGTKGSRRVGKSVVVTTGLLLADVFVGVFFLLLGGWIVLLGGSAIASAAGGLCLGFRLDGFGIIPPMPSGCALIYMLALLALAVLAAAGTIYCFLYARQLLRAYSRWHANALAAARGTAVYPALSTHPQIAPKWRRRLRAVTLVSLTVFAVSFIAGYAVSAFAAGSLEFWHVWQWFTP